LKVRQITCNKKLYVYTEYGRFKNVNFKLNISFGDSRIKQLPITSIVKECPNIPTTFFNIKLENKWRSR